jgi:hypothetical protein
MGFFLAILLSCYVYNWIFGVQTVNIKVKMDCEGCERRVKNAVKSINGTEMILQSNSLGLNFPVKND